MPCESDNESRVGEIRHAGHYGHQKAGSERRKVKVTNDISLLHWILTDTIPEAEHTEGEVNLGPDSDFDRETARGNVHKGGS